MIILFSLFIIQAHCQLPSRQLGKNAKALTELHQNSLKFIFTEKTLPFESTVSPENISKSSLPIHLPRKLLTKAPYTAYQRGIYFPGEVGLATNIKNKLLGVEFSISIWLRPLIESSVILSKYDDQNQNNYLMVYYTNLTLRCKVLIKDTIYEYNSSLKLDFKLWNHIYLSNSYSQYNTFIMWLNGYPGQSQDFSDVPFIDSDNGTLFIGSDKNNDSPFFGFVYSVEVFGNNQNLSDLVSLNCTLCRACLVNGTCLSTCDIGTYYSYSINKCENCPEVCRTSCISDSICSLCKDSKCVSCSSLNLKSCLACSPGYQVINNTCFPCSKSTYYNSYTSTCVNCPKLCIECFSSLACKSCQDLSYLNKNNLCECIKGYSYYNSSCVRNNFSAVIYINEYLKVDLNFTEPLKESLNRNQVELFINNKSVEFSLISVDVACFEFQFDIKILEQNSSVNVKFKEEIVSLENSLLSIKELNSTIHLNMIQKEEVKTQVKVEETKTVASSGMTTGATIALSASLINFNPTAFFDFLNTAEVFYSVYFYNIELHLVLEEFLLTCRLHKSIPNVFSYIFPPVYGNKLSSTYKKFGYSTNLFILNAYADLQTIILLLIFWAIIIALTKVKMLKDKLNKIASLFKYEIFLRYWVQCFFEFSLAVRVSLMFNSFDNAAQIIDLLFCIIVIILLAAGFCFYIYLFLLRKRITDESRLEEFMKQFGAFFEEFKQDHYKRWMFYLLFLVRRILIMICYLSSNAVLQLSIATVMSFIVPLYILFMQSFKLSIMNIYHISKEMLIAIFNCVLLYSSNNDHMSDQVSDICVRIVITAWAMNVLFSIVTTVKKIVGLIRECRKKKNSRMNTVETLSKIQPESEFDFIKSSESTKRGP